MNKSDNIKKMTKILFGPSHTTTSRTLLSFLSRTAEDRLVVAARTLYV